MGHERNPWVVVALRAIRLFMKDLNGCMFHCWGTSRSLHKLTSGLRKYRDKWVAEVSGKFGVWSIFSSSDGGESGPTAFLFRSLGNDIG